MAWYDTSWLKRKRVILTGGSSGVQTDYQIKLDITYDSNMQADFDDLRFTKADGTTLLNAWLESKVDSTSAVVWVETDTPADTVEADIYMYYGNSEASSDWDISSTFLFGDDFEFEASTEFGFFGSVEYNRDTTTKLSAAVSAFNTWGPDFVIENGDFIDSQTGTKAQAITDLGVVEAIYDNLTMDRHYVFGNHDLNYLTKAEFFSNTGKTSRYYSFDSGDHHFIVLDDMYDVSGNDIEEETASNPSRYIPSTESTWLTNDLAGTSKKTIIFVEAHLYGKVSTQMIQNASAIRTILEDSEKVLACFHSHAGDNTKDTLNGIDYYSMYAMDNAGTNAYAKVTVRTDDTIQIEGISSQDSYSENDTWTVGADASIASGIATLDGSGGSASIRATYVTPDNTISTARVRLANTNCRDYFIPFSESTPSGGGVGGMHYDIPLGSSKDYRLREDAVDVISGGDGTGVSTTVWHTQELIKSGTSWTLKLDNVQEGATTRTYSDSHPYYSIYAYNSSSVGNVDIDYTYVRDYVANPATYEFESESESVPSSWYDTSWLKRRKVTLTGGASGAQTNYQVRLNITYDSDMQTDFDDLRFTKANGTTLLNAWLESKVDSTSAIVWVETDTPDNTIVADIYMYYDNSAAVSDWDIDATMLFGDEFGGSELDTNKWTVQQGAVTVGSDYLRLTQTTGTRGLIDGKTAIPLNAAVHSRARTSIENVTGSRFNTFRGAGAWTTIAGGFVRYSSGEMATQAYTSGSGSTDDWDSVYSPTSWHTYKTTWKSGEVKGYLDDNLRATVTSYVPTADLVVACYEGNTSSGYTEVDWIFVTKFVSDPATYEFGSKSEYESSSWYNTSWSKRKRVLLTGDSSGAQTDYQVKFDITYDSDMDADFADLRFTASDGTTLLDYWIEDYTASTSAVVWVETDTPADAVESGIYMYYDNSGAVSVSNGENTFLFFDDFPGTALDGSKWATTTGSTVSGGELSVVVTSGNGSHTSSGWNRDVAFRGSVKRAEPGDGNMIGFVAGWGTDACVFRQYTDNRIQVFSGGSQTTVSGDTALTTYKTVDVTWLTDEVRYIVDGVEETNSPITTNVPTSSIPIGFHGVTSKTMYSEWVLVRNYVANPATYEFESESESGEPVPEPTPADWYNVSWSNRRKITLTGGLSGAQTDYQVKFDVTYDSDMQVDFDDLRFTKTDGTTLLNAWLESKTDSTTAEIWVKTDTPADAVDADIYMYYGNSGASSNWDGPNTFLQFDDFNDGSITDWSGQTASFEASTDTSYEGTHSLKKTGSNSHSNAYIYKTETTSDIEIESRVWNSDALKERGGIFISKSADPDNYYALYFDPNGSLSIAEFNNGAFVSNRSRTLTLASISSAQWCKYVLRKVGTTWDIYVYLANGNVVGSITGYSSPAFTPGYVGIHAYDQSQYADQFKVRKYAVNPATYAFGDEETEWYDSNWTKRKAITLTGDTDGAQTDYQIKLTIAWNSDMQADFSDLRFTRRGATLIDCWMEDYTASTSATIWVEFPTTPADGETEDYYMYYGNSGASSDFSGPNTFLQYHGVETLQFIDSLVVAPSDIAYEAKCKVTASTHNIRFGLSNNVSHSVDDSMGVSPASAGDLRYGYVRNEGAITYKSETPAFTNDVYYRVMATLTDSAFIAYVDGNQIETGTITTNLPNETLGLGMDVVTGTAAQDWSFARKHVTNPATYVFDDEQVEWYDSDWEKRKAITLTGAAGGAQTDYQIKLTVAYDSDMKSDFSDLRFTEADGTTLIDCWMEDHTESTSAAVWVKFPTTPASDEAEYYYMYYGNSGASDVYNGTNTFPEYFDDFSSDTIADYTERHYATWSAFTHKEITDGELHIGFNETEYGSSVLFHTASTVTNSGYAMRSRFRAIGYHSDASLFRHQKEIGLTTDTTPTYVAACSCDPDFSGWHSDGCINMPDNHCQTTDISGTTTDEIVYSLDGSTYYPGFWVQDISSSGSTSELWVTWALVRKDVINPATYEFGSESEPDPGPDPGPTSSDWYNALWLKRRKITLTGGASGAQTDYQMGFVIDYDPNMKTDFSDLRFTESDGVTLLDMWTEVDEGSFIRAWVKTDIPEEDVEDYIYMYYGNPDALVAIDGNATFLLFDDFDGSSIDSDKWEGTNLPAVSDSKVHLDGIRDINSKAVYDFAQPVLTLYSIDMHHTMDIGKSALGCYIIDRNASVVTISNNWYAPSGTNDRYISGVTSNWWPGTGKGASTGESRHEIQILSPSRFRWGCSGVRTFDDTRTDTDNYPTSSTRYLRFNTGYLPCDVDILWVAVAKSVEYPATYIVGSEENIWYNMAWGRRQPITLTGGSSGAQTDYQVKLDVTFDSDMQSDFSDLRFTESDGITPLSAWLELYTESISAVIWVKTDTPADTVESDIYMYYGNSEAVSAWSGPDTFIQWHGFADCSSEGHFMDPPIVHPADVAYGARVRVTDNHIIVWGLFVDVDHYSYITSQRGSDFVGLYTEGGDSGQISVTEQPRLTNSVWHDLVITNDGTNLCGYIDDDMISEGCITNGLPDVNVGLYMGIFSSPGTGEQDWSYAREYVVNSATYVHGDEEVWGNWYDGSWLMRKVIILTGGASGAQTDYQVKLEIPYSPNMQVDFDDLRFTESDGVTLLDAWLETKVDSTSAVIWVKTDTPAEDIEATIYMYYHNTEALSIWDGPNTFIQFVGEEVSAYTAPSIVHPTNVAYGGRFRVQEDQVFGGGLRTADNGTEYVDIISHISLGTVGLYCRGNYNTTSVSETPPMSVNVWHDTVITNDSVNVCGYLDGDLIADSCIDVNLPTFDLGLSFNLYCSPPLVEQAWAYAREYVVDSATYIIEEDEGEAGSMVIFMIYYKRLRGN